MSHTLHGGRGGGQRGGGNSGGGGSGGWTIWHTLFYIFIACTVLAKCFGGSDGSSSLGNAPSAPQTPPPRTATFYSDADSPNHMAVTLTGGSYAFQYVTIDQYQAGEVLSSGRRVAVVDFDANKVTGSLDDAEDLVVIGTPHLEVGAFSGSQEALSQFATVAGTIKYARFNLSAPPTGPPDTLSTDDSRKEKLVKNIYIVGALSSVVFDGTRQDAEHRVEVLELDPTDSDWNHYRDQMSEYARKKSEYEQQERHQTDTHPVERAYHPI